MSIPRFAQEQIEQVRKGLEEAYDGLTGLDIKYAGLEPIGSMVKSVAMLIEQADQLEDAIEGHDEEVRYYGGYEDDDHLLASEGDGDDAVVVDGTL